MCDHDPAESVTVPTVDNARHVYIEREAMLKISRACTHRSARMAIRIAFYSGMRLSEILRAKMINGVFVLADTKNGEPRRVPVHPKIAACARRINGATPRITIQRAYQRARERVDMLGLRFHDLRHSSASAMINAGVPLYTVGAVLGHKDPRSTQQYAHLDAAALQNAVMMIGKKPPTPHPEKQKKRA